MTAKSPFSIIKSRHVTEKSMVLQELETSESNRCTARCKTPKVVFIVDQKANKHEIATAVEQIYADRKVKVLKVNVLNVKPKKRRVRGRTGFKPGYRKAVVTLEPGDKLEEV